MHSGDVHIGSLEFHSLLAERRGCNPGTPNKAYEPYSVPAVTLTTSNALDLVLLCFKPNRCRRNHVLLLQLSLKPQSR